MNFLLRLILISATTPLLGAIASPTLALTRQEVMSAQSEHAFWKFYVKNVSEHQVTIAIEHKYSYINSDQYRPIFSADISDFRGNRSSEGSLKTVSDFSADQGLILSPGDSLAVPSLSFHSLPSSISAKFAVRDSTWKEASVTWSKETEQDAAATP